MSSVKPHQYANQDYYNVEKNQDLVVRLFQSYYRGHHTSGKLFDDFPDFFLVKPIVLKGQELAQRASDKLLMSDCIARAQERRGFIGVSKRRNPKLKYYWLELDVFPFKLGDTVDDNNKAEFFFILSHFIEFSRNNPKIYGDMAAERARDKDLALMLQEIERIGAGVRSRLEHYSEDMLVSFNRAWPFAELNKLLMTLKDNDQGWCQVFFEHLMYMMSRKGKTPESNVQGAAPSLI